MKQATLKRIIREMKPYGFRIGLSLLLTAISVVFSLFVPVLLGRAVDCFPENPGGTEDILMKLLPILGEMAGVIVISGVCLWLTTVLNQGIVYRVAQSLRNRMFMHLHELPLSALDRRQSGDLVSRMVADVDQVTDGLLMGFSQLFNGVLSIVVTFIFMLLENVWITLAIAVATPLSLVVTRFIAKKSHKYFEAQAKSRGAETAFINEILPNEKTVKTYGQEDESVAKFAALDETLRKHSLKAIFYSSLVNPTTRFLNALIYALGGMLGALTVISTGGAFSVGSLACFLAFAAQYAKPFNEISGVVTELQNAIVSAARIFEILDLPKEEDPPRSASADRPVRGEVVFDDVSFSYVPEKPLIRHFSLKVEPGQHIAIVGRTGCGKTTLINLLMGFYPVNSGEIRIDGQPTDQMSREELREKFGMVLQETWLMAGTVSDNIRIGKPDATEAEVREAAKRAHADGFIRRMEHGYDTVLQENGGALSEGQKQLLCIARLMLALPPMLILDEATSSIDTRTELRIQDAFSRLMEGRTGFIVAHRLSTIRNADRILVMENGHITEQGRHEELLAAGGHYKELYESQFKGVAV